MIAGMGGVRRGDWLENLLGRKQRKAMLRGACGKFLKHLLTLSHALAYSRRFTARTLLAQRAGAAHS